MHSINIHLAALQQMHKTTPHVIRTASAESFPEPTQLEQAARILQGHSTSQGALQDKYRALRSLRDRAMLSSRTRLITWDQKRPLGISWLISTMSSDDGSLEM